MLVLHLQFGSNVILISATTFLSADDWEAMFGSNVILISATTLFLKRLRKEVVW